LNSFEQKFRAKYPGKGKDYIRKQEFSENGEIGKQIRSHKVAYKHNDIVFVHGGISIDFANRAVNQWMKNYKVLDPIDAINHHASYLVQHKLYRDPFFWYNLSSTNANVLIWNQRQRSAGPLW
jgi:hypothetical protein